MISDLVSGVPEWASVPGFRGKVLTPVLADSLKKA